MSRLEMHPTEIAAQLAEFFPPEAIGWVPAATTKDKTKAMAAAYIDARDVMARLDAVVGVDGWQDEYIAQADGTVICKLSVRVGDWVTKMDVGCQSEQEDAGNRMKAAFSDALKRAAVKFGIGRYLYSLPQKWYGWDQQRRQFSEPPSLPAWALPKKKTSEPVKSDNPSPRNGAELGELGGTMAQQMPKTGANLLERMLAKDKKESAAKLIRPNELVQYIRQRGIDVGYPDDIGQWNSESQIKFAWEETLQFLGRKHRKVITTSQEEEIYVACQERGKDIDQLCDELQVKGLADIPEMHYSSIMMKLRELPIKPVVASSP